MGKLNFRKTRLLFMMIVLSCVGCNAQQIRCRTKVTQCDSLVVKSDSMNNSCDTMAVCCDLLKQTTGEEQVAEQDLIMCINETIDSITEIISHFKRVECELQCGKSYDTTNVGTKKVLPRKYNEVLRFLLLDNDNYKTNEIVYGLFSSSIRYKIIQSRCKYIYAEFDFGLSKWQILDSENKVLFQGDMKENSLQMLRFSRIVFPEDETLKVLQDNLKTLL